MSHYVTLYRLKPEIKNFGDAIKGKPPRKFDLPATSSFDFDARLYVDETAPKEPPWATLLRDGFGPLTFALTPSVRAVLLVRAKGVGVLYAITFGSGRFMLAADAYERSFGLKTALNVIFEGDKSDDPITRLRRVDAKTVSENTLHVNRQANKGADFDMFGIDIRRDLLGGVTGEPADTKTWKTRIVGSDALGTWAGPEFARIDQLIARVEKAYSSDHYVRRFSWIDNVRIVRDKKTIAALQSKITKMVKTGKIADLAPPEIVDWARAAKFVYSISSSDEFPELRFADYHVALKAWVSKRPSKSLTVDDLKAHHVEVQDEDGKVVHEWSILSCLDIEVEHNGATYLLVGGDFFVVAEDYVKDLDSAIASIAECKLKLPDGKAGEWEGKYNESVAAALNFLNLDTETVKAKTTTTAVEVCDLLTEKGQLIHIKRELGSANLSHLFAQGYVSADLLLSSVEFRRAALAKIRSLESTPGKFSGLFTDTKFVPTDFEVVYGIITNWKGRTLQKALPFFSKVTLRRYVEDLRRLQFGVSYRRIQCV